METKRVYKSSTTQCKYLKQNKIQCVRKARGEFCAWHTEAALARNRAAALANYHKSKAPKEQLILV